MKGDGSGFGPSRPSFRADPSPAEPLCRNGSRSPVTEVTDFFGIAISNRMRHSLSRAYSYPVRIRHFRHFVHLQGVELGAPIGAGRC